MHQGLVAYARHPGGVGGAHLLRSQNVDHDSKMTSAAAVAGVCVMLR